MRDALPRVIAGLALYALFLVVLAPASLVFNFANFPSGTRVKVNEVGGTLWRGSASLSVGVEAQRVGALHWQANPLWLLIGRLRAEIEMNEPELKLHSVFDASRRSLRLSGTRGSMSASVMEKLYTPLELLGLGGVVRAEGDAFAVSADATSGALDLFVDKLTSRSSTVSPLGSYRLSLSGEGREVNIQLTTLSGDLALAGQGEWRPSTGVLHFEGAARPLAHAAELEPLLQLLGPDRGNGQRSLAVNLNLTL